MLRTLGLRNPATGDAAPTSEIGRYAVEVVDKIDASWDKVATKFSDVCLEQTSSYMLARWDSSRLCGLIVRDMVTLETEAAALAVVAALPVLKFGLAFIKFGPMWRRNDRPARPNVLNAALSALKQEFAKLRGLRVRVMPPAEPDYASAWTTGTAAEEFKLQGPAESPERYLVDLKLSEDEQLASLGAKCRANLRKVDTQALDIREVDPQANMPAFMSLYRAMSERKHFVDHHHIKALPAFVAAAPQALALRMFMATSHGHPVAGSIVAGSGDSVSVPFSASGLQALPLRAGFALRWAIMNSLRSSPARWLDLGGDEGDPGLRHFKAGNVGSRGRVLLLPGEYDYAGSAMSSAATAAIRFAHNLSRAHPLHRFRSAK